LGLLLLSLMEVTHPHHGALRRRIINREETITSAYSEAKNRFDRNLLRTNCGSATRGTLTDAGQRAAQPKAEVGKGF
ncbi:MAG: hypothetical protein OES26_24005, partial [Gammaproteobacteria bacterium]|nr:hypothetical protein [Gammaproteobacteria bacterium]